MKTITIDVINKTAVAEVVEGDVGVKVTITNTPQEWKNCTVFALITQDSATQHIKVINNKFDVPPAFTDANKAFKIGVYAVGADATRDIRPSIWIRVADSDFTTEDIEITSQTLDDILMLQSQYTQYQNAEKNREDAEAVRVSNEEQRINAEAKRDRDLSKISDDIERLDNSVDDLGENKVDRIAGFGLSSFMLGGIGIYNDRKDETLVMKLYNTEQIDSLLAKKAEKNEIAKSISDAIAKLVNNSPEALDTIYELAKALGEDPNFATTVMNEISKKVDKVNGYGLAQIGAIGDFITISMHSKDISNAISYLLYDAAKIDRMLEDKADMGDVENLKGQLQSGETVVNNANYADYANSAAYADCAYFDLDGNAFAETYAKKTKVSIQMPDNDILVPDTEYSLGVVLDLTIHLPSNVNIGDVVYLTFISGEDATTLAIETTNAYDFELIPEPKMAYEIYGKYDGRKWMLGYAEFNVSDDDLI